MSNFDDDCIEGGSKVQLNDTTSHVLTAYKGASYEENFYNIGRLVAVQFFRVSGTSLFVVIKYPRLKRSRSLVFLGLA